jgi:cytochrome c553
MRGNRKMNWAEWFYGCKIAPCPVFKAHAVQAWARACRTLTGKPWRAGLAAALLLIASGVPAQPLPAAPSVRMPPKTVPDTMAERVAACTACHGKEGRATNVGYFPRIAGKPAGYLYNQLINFREGRRVSAQMAGLLDNLSDAYLRDMAAYFAALDLPYPPPAPMLADPGLMAQGERLMRVGDAARQLPACAACHGDKLTGMQPATPGLVGLPRDYLTSQLGAWQIDTRRAHAPDCMAAIAKKLTPQEVNAVTLWLVSQPVPADAKPAPAKPLPAACGGQGAQP